MTNAGIESLVRQRIKDYKDVARSLEEEHREAVMDSHRLSICQLSDYCQTDSQPYIEMYETGIDYNQKKNDG